jgi:hypothetical protein
MIRSSSLAPLRDILIPNDSPEDSGFDLAMWQILLTCIFVSFGEQLVHPTSSNRFFRFVRFDTRAISKYENPLVRSQISPDQLLDSVTLIGSHVANGSVNGCLDGLGHEFYSSRNDTIYPNNRHLQIRNLADEALIASP